MNTFTATQNTRTLNNQALASFSTKRYRNRDFGVGYGRSEGYARSHSLWSTTSAKRSRYC